MRERIKDYKEKLSQWILSAYFKKKNIKFDIYIYIYIYQIQNQNQGDFIKIAETIQTTLNFQLILKKKKKIEFPTKICYTPQREIHSCIILRDPPVANSDQSLVESFDETLWETQKKKKIYGPFQFGMITRRVHNGSTSYKVKTKLLCYIWKF